MSSEFQAFQALKDKENNIMSNKKLTNVIKSYSYLYLTDTFDLEMSNIQNLTNSSVIMINHYKNQSNENDELHFIIVFRKTVLIIKQSLLPNFQPLFRKKDKLKICFFEDTKNIFEESIKIEYEEAKNSSFFEKEISQISKEFFNYKQFQYNEFLNAIKSCISGYLIQQSYCDLNYDRIKDFYSTSKKEIIPRKMNANELIELRMIGIGSSFQTVLYYHIYDEILCVIKKPHIFDPEIEKLLQREQSNYTKIKHPFIPKYYGTIDINGKKCLIIEFINGQTLSSIDCSKFSISEQIIIILQMLSVIKYLHENNFIYRDMKPNNVIIDENKSFVVIDFDRMIEYKNNINEVNDPHTIDFGSGFRAPEINDKNLTNKCDIYSIGKMIKKIIPDIERNEYYSIIHRIYLLCIDENPSKRPFVAVFLCLIFIFIDLKNITLDFSLDFYNNDPNVQLFLGVTYVKGKYVSRDINKAIYYFEKAADQNHPEAQYNLGVIYYEGLYITRDINKAIHYFSLASNTNHSEAQYYLGLIYYLGQYISRDINKSIYYFEKAAKQNNPKAYNFIGSIYYEGKYIQQNINKAIYYFSLAANQNHPEAQYNLGVIYYEGKYISRDINKSIYYFFLASKQNDPEAQNNLGLLYYKSQYIPRDINKAIYYFSLASNQNHPEAQYNLGLIYYKSQYIPQDINTSIYYFSLAANQNHPEAQYNLGVFYYEGKYISRDINKSIYYFSLASNQNHPEAQYNLGLIYYEGKNISRDINKAIYYYSLAANQNHPEAQFYLGLIYYLGQYISRDITKSIYYFSLAANQNHPKAQYNLGVIYYLGQYISRDINKAIYFFSLAANQKHLKSQNILGLIYYEGKYISRDINKTIYYFEKVANQNEPQAQHNLGVIYYEGKYISRDINNSIHYFSLASNQNHSNAQFYLGFIYYSGQYIPRDINKAIYYYSLAANQNHPQAQYNLGLIYYLGQYISQDIIKAIYYFEKGVNQNYAKAQHILGLIYYEGKYISRDINKSIRYFTLAANQNYPQAQYDLGVIYYKGIDIKQNIKRGIYWITKSSNNDCIQAHFALGFLYQEGKYVKRNIEESIKYYKKASSFNNQYAKNNLGIIYKNYFEKKYDYTVYFEEAIRQKNDPVSMYNLSHAYIYEYQDEQLINKSIELLIKSSNLGFKPSIVLLCIIILKKIFNKQANRILVNIESEISEFTEKTNELTISIFNIIQELLLYDRSNFEYFFKIHAETVFIYDLNAKPIFTEELYNREYEYSSEKYKISSEFYEGFGYNIYKKQ